MRPPRLKRRGGMGILLTALGILVAVAVIGPLLPLPAPNAQDLSRSLKPPVWAGGAWSDPLGTDFLGRDMLARLVAGTRLTLVVAGLAVAVGATVGSAMGLLAGYRRGALDTVISRLVDAQLAIPFILFAIAIVSARGRSLPILVMILASISWAQYARLVRTDALVVREKPFVMSLRAAGLPTWRIVLAHVLPNVGGTILVVSTLEIGTAVLGESALSFLGLGVVSPQISWGAMLAEGRTHLVEAWWVVALPGVAITLLVLIVNLLGDALRATYDPRKRIYT